MVFMRAARWSAPTDGRARSPSAPSDRNDGRAGAPRTPQNDRKAKFFFVPKDEIVANNYDLSFNKYREVEYVAEKFPPTAELMGEIDTLTKDFAAGLKELKGML